MCGPLRTRPVRCTCLRLPKSDGHLMHIAVRSLRAAPGGGSDVADVLHVLTYQLESGCRCDVWRTQLDPKTVTCRSDSCHGWRNVLNNRPSCPSGTIDR